MNPKPGIVTIRHDGILGSSYIPIIPAPPKVGVYCPPASFKTGTGATLRKGKPNPKPYTV